MLKLVVEVSERSTPVARRVLITDPEGTALAYAGRLDHEHWIAVPHGTSFHFRPGSDQITAHADPNTAPGDVVDAYYGAALPMAVQVVLGGQALHASAVVMPGAGVFAFCGLSHAGKTTLAYGLSGRGYTIWADDVVAVDESAAADVMSLRLPFRLNLRPQSADHFDAMPDGGGSQADGEFPEWAREPLAAVFVLEPLDRPRPPRRHAAWRLSPKEALLALLANAFYFQPQTSAERRKMMQDYLEVAARVPVFRLDVRPGLDTLPALLDEIEQTVARHTRLGG